METACSYTLGIFCGLAAYSFYVSNAVSYLSDEPETCINCHIMIPQYAAWNHSSHREKAHCNDCHVPHNNALNKYYFKAKDGLRHATLFTLRMEPQVIKIKDAGKAVVQQNCIRCHERLNSEISTIEITLKKHYANEGKLCWNCHTEVPHGYVNSLSATPYARTDANTPNRIAEWITKSLKKPKH